MEAYGVHVGVLNLLRFTFGRIRVDGSESAAADSRGGRPYAAPRPPVIELRDRDGVWVDLSSTAEQGRSPWAVFPSHSPAAFAYDETGAQVSFAITRGLRVNIFV